MKTNLNKLRASIVKVAAELDTPPTMLTKAQFLGSTDAYTDWDLRKLGGFSNIVKASFPDVEKDLEASYYLKSKRSYAQALEKRYGSLEAFKTELMEDMGEKLKDLNIKPLVLDAKATDKFLRQIAEKPVGNTERRSVVTVWSDQHFGTNVDEAELAGKNHFNWTIGARRLAMLCEQIATYKIERRKLHDELVIFLLGDNLGGIIHNQEGPDYDLITYQVNGTLYYYAQALSYLKNFYPKIRVLCQPGNHGRMQHKSSKERALAQKYDSFENIIFYSLSCIFNNDKTVEISAPKAPYIDAQVQGHRVFGTHGDTVFETGNVGKMVNLGKIENQIHRINAEELSNNKKAFELFVSGHVHHPVVTQVGPGINVMINGCLIGTDSYALGVGIFSSSPVQLLWEATENFAQGDTRLIYVESADKKEKYDDIIKPYNYSLTV